MADTIIEFFPEKQTPPRYGGWWINGVRFVAGLNTLTSKVYTQMKKTEAFNDMIACGAFAVVKPDAPVAVIPEQPVETPIDTPTDVVTEVI